MSAIYTKEGEALILNQYLAAIGANIKLGLYKALSGIGGKDAILSNITACDFSGYAIQSTAWSTGTIDSAEKFVKDGGTYTFTRAAGATSNNVLGYYLVDITNSTLLFYEQFSAPIAMNTAGDA